MSIPVKTRRTNEERSATTRTRLLEATIDALVDDGYAAATTTVIAERAGVSRGAQLHHYPTKADLVAAAVEHLAERLLEQFSAALEATPASDRVDFVIDAMWSSFSAPLLAAWVELSVAARTDAELRRQLQRVTTRLQDSIMERASGAPDALVVIAMTLWLFEGFTIERRSRIGQRRSRELAPVMLDTWKRMVRATFPTL